MFTFDRHNTNTNKKVAEATAGKTKPITVHASFFVYKFVIYELNQATKVFFRPERMMCLRGFFIAVVVYVGYKEN